MDYSLRSSDSGNKDLASTSKLNAETTRKEIEDAQACLKVFKEAIEKQDSDGAASGLKTLSSTLERLSKNTDLGLKPQQTTLLNTLIKKTQDTYNALKSIEAQIKEKTTKIDFNKHFDSYSPLLTDISKTLGEITQTINAISQNSELSPLPLQKISQATRTIFWALDLDQKSFDASMSHNLAALFLGGSSISNLKISGEQIEGGDTLTVCSFIKTLLEEEWNGIKQSGLEETVMKEAEERFLPLIRSIDTIIKTEQQARICQNGHPKNIRLASQDFATWMQKTISNLKEGESYQLFGGWQGTPSGHAMLYEITRQNKNKFTMKVFNTGSGIEFHPCKIGNNSKHIPFLTQSDIEKETLCNSPEIWRSYYELKFVNAPAEAPYTSSDIYLRFLKSIHPTFGLEMMQKTHGSDDAYINPQEAGTCSVESIMVFIRATMDHKKTYKSFENALKFRVLLKYVLFLENRGIFNLDPTTTISPEQIRERIAILSLLKTNTQRFSRNITKALSHSWISKADGSHASTFLDEVLNKIAKAEKYYQSKYAKASPLLNLGVQETSRFNIGKFETVKESKEAWSKSGIVLDTNRIAWPEKDLKELREVLQGWIDTVNKIYSEKPNEAYFFIQDVFQKMPSINAEIWKSIPKNEIEACMASITDLTELYLKTRQSRTQNNDQYVEEICHIQKAFAVVACLANRLDPEHVGKLVLDTSYLSHNLKNLSAYNGWMSINNPKMDQELTETLQFFQTLFKEQKGIFPPLKTDEYVYKLYNKDPTSKKPFEQQMSDLKNVWDDEIAFIYRYLTENEKIKASITAFLESKNIKPASHAIVAVALTDLTGLYLPKAFCLLKKQAYLTQIAVRFQEGASSMHKLTLEVHKSLKPEDIEYETLKIIFSDIDIEYPMNRSHFATTRLLIKCSKKNVCTGINSRETEFRKEDQSSPLIRFFTNNFPGRTTQNEIELKQFASRLYYNRFQVNEEARDILRLICHEDKSQQIVKTIKFFKANPRKLDQRDYQLIFEALIFERGVLSSQLKAHPEFADILSNFIQESYDLSIFLKKYEAGAFLLRMGDYAKDYCRHNNIKHATPFPDMVKELEKLIRQKMSGKEKSIITRELLAAYSRKESFKLDDVLAILPHAFYLADHPIVEESGIYAPQLNMAIQNLYRKIALTLNAAQPQARNAILSSAVGLAPSEPWDFSKFPFLTANNGRYEIDLLTCKLYIEGTESTELPEWITTHPYFRTIFPTIGSINRESVRVQGNLEYGEKGKVLFTDPLGHEYRLFTQNYHIISSFQSKINNEWCNYISTNTLLGRDDNSIYSSMWDNQLTIDPTNTLLPVSNCWLSPSCNKIYFVHRESRKINYEYEPKSGQITCIDKGLRQNLSLVNNQIYRSSKDSGLSINFFKSFDVSSQLWKDDNNKVRIIELPKYGIHFEVVYHNNQIVGVFPTPRQEGFRLSKEQYLPALKRVPSYIVLEDHNGKKRVLIPRREFGHSTDISQLLSYNKALTGTGQDAYYTLHIDSKGRLTSSDLAGRLYLAYIHLVQRDYQLAHDILFTPHRCQKLSANQSGESAAYSHEEFGLLNMIINSGGRDSTDDHDTRASAIRLKAYALQIENKKFYGETPEKNNVVKWPKVDLNIISRDLLRYVTQSAQVPAYTLPKEQEAQLLLDCQHKHPIFERRLRLLRESPIHARTLSTEKYISSVSTPQMKNSVYAIDINVLDSISSTMRLTGDEFRKLFYSFYRIAKEEPPESDKRKRLSELMALASYDLYGPYEVCQYAICIQSVLSKPQDYPSTFELCAAIIAEEEKLKESYTYLLNDLDTKILAEIPIELKNNIIGALHKGNYKEIDNRNAQINKLLISQNSDAIRHDILRILLQPYMSADIFEEYTKKQFNPLILSSLFYCLQKCKDVHDIKLLLAIPPELIKLPDQRWFTDEKIISTYSTWAIESLFEYAYQQVDRTKILHRSNTLVEAVNPIKEPAHLFIPLERKPAIELPPILFSKQLEGKPSQAELDACEKSIKEIPDNRNKLAGFKEAFEKQQSAVDAIARTQAEQLTTKEEVEAVAKISAEISRLQQEEIQIQSNMALRSNAEHLIKMQSNIQKPFFVKEKTDPHTEAQEKKIHAELRLRLESAQKALTEKIEIRKIEALKVDIESYAKQVREPQMLLQRTELPVLEKTLREQLDLETAHVTQMKRALRELANKLPLPPLERAQRSMNLRNGRIKRISIKELQLLYLRGNVTEFQRRNPSLSDADVALLGQLTQEFLVRGTRQQQLKRTLDELMKLSDKLKTLPDTDPGVVEQMQEVYKTLTAKRFFVPHEHPEFLVFEYQANVLMRKNQVEGMQKLLEKGSNLIQQIIMGGGKSDILLVLLALRKANGKNLSVIMVPDELMKQVSDNIQMRSGDIFQQVAQRINWHDISVVGLQRILERLHEIRNNRDFLLMTSKDMHDFALRAQEYRLNCSKKVGALDNFQKDTLKLFVEIKQFLRVHGDVIIDEVDSVLHCRKEVHIALNEGIQINQQYIDITDIIYSILLSDPSITKQISFDFAKHTGKQPFSLDLYKTIKNELIAKIFEKLKATDLLKPYGNYFKQITEYIFIENDKQAQELPNELPPELKNALAFLRSELHIFLPMTLNKRYDENYGLFSDHAMHEFQSRNQQYVPRPEDFFIAGPFEGVNTPKIGSQFGHYTEQINYTRQAYARGIPHHLVINELERIKQAVTNEFLVSQLSSVTEASAYQEYVNICGDVIAKEHNLVQLDTDGMKVVSKKISDNPELLQRFVGKYILPKITLYKYRISSNAQNLPEMFQCVQGFTGTLPNEDMFHNRFTTKPQEGIDGSILIQLAKNSLNAVYPVNENAPEEILQTMMKAPDAHEYKTLIDEGGLFKSLSNRVLADRILSARRDLEAIIYFEGDRPMILKRGQSPLPFNKSNDIDPNKRFTIYDQKHCRGTHVDQAHQAKGWVTTNRIDILSNIEQAIYRMRRIAAGQIVSFLIPHDLNDLVKRHAGKNDKIDVMDLMITLARTQARQIADDNLLSIQQKMNNLVMQACQNALDKAPIEDTNKPIFQELNQILVKIIEDAPYQQYGQVEYPEHARIVLENYRDNALQPVKAWVLKYQTASLPPLIDTKSLSEEIDKIINKALVDKKEQVNEKLPFHPKAGKDSAKGTQVQVAVRAQTEVQQKINSEQQMQMEVQQQLEMELEQQMDQLRYNTQADRHSRWLKIELMFTKQYYSPIQWAGSKEMTTQAALKSEQNCWLAIDEVLGLSYDKQLSADLFGTHKIYAHIDQLFTRTTDLKPFGALQKSFGACLIVQDVQNPQQIELRPIDALGSEIFKVALLQDKSKRFAGVTDKRICLYDPDIGIYQQGSEPLQLEALAKANPNFNLMLVQYKFLSAKMFGYTKEELSLLKSWFSGMKQSPSQIENFFKDALLKDPHNKAVYPNSQLAKFFAALSKEKRT